MGDMLSRGVQQRATSGPIAEHGFGFTGVAKAHQGCWGCRSNHVRRRGGVGTDVSNCL